MLDTFDGLPVHVLVVHAVVVLVPLSAAGLVVVALAGRWRRSYSGSVALLATGGLVATYLARQSGRWLRDTLGYGDGFQHGQVGARLVWFVLALWAAAVALWLVQRRGAPAAVLRGVGAAAVVVAVLASWQTIEVGESGARSVWEPKLSEVGAREP